jgi:ketosteroid isomerase-like protein
VSKDTEASRPESEIRAIVETRTRAVRDRDVEALMAHVSPSVVSYDVVNPLEYHGAGEVRARAREWFASFAGAIDLQVHDLRIMAGEGVAYCSSLNRIRGAVVTGGEIDMWIRSTLCLTKEDGRWVITHQHTSVPFAPATGQASLDLRP